jgi:hypothetical protein
VSLFVSPKHCEVCVSIIGSIWDRVIDAGKAVLTRGGAAKSAAPGGPVAAGGSPVPNPVPSAGSPTAAGTPSAPVDVEAIMTDLESKSGHKSNWRYSIVDLMSLLGMDHSLANRKALAQELGYTGNMNDSASMNIWLHKQVMKRMAQNGGKVPADLLD